MRAHAASAGTCDLHAPRAPADPACARSWMDENLHLNDVMIVGTHNSYKAKIPDAEFAVLKAHSTDGAIGLDYAHRPLEQQLEEGARQLEIDVYSDVSGGRFAHPLGPKLAGTRLDPDYVREMTQPGLKVMHMPDVDFHSTCATFRKCLRIIKTWSAAHPRHAPILITMNTKDGAPSIAGGTSIAPFDAQAYDELDAEIASVFSREELVTPDQVQGKYPTLREAVLAGNWPKLGAARGKILFALDEGPEKVALYRGARRSLEGRLVFVNTDESSPAAAYITLNDPIGEGERIRAAVRAGFIVRTRADADTVEARSGATVRREAAFASGAQYISTDYMHPDLRFSSYFVRLEGKAAAVCNPVRTADRCLGHVIE